MVPDVVPPPPPPPMPSANFVPPKPALTIVKSEKSASPPRNPVTTNDSMDNVINEIKNKGGTLRKTKRKDVVPVEECIVPQINLKSIQNQSPAKPTFKNEIVVNIVPSTTIKNVVKISSTNIINNTTTKVNAPDVNGTAFKLRRPSEFLNGTKPELVPANKEVLKPHLAPKVSVNGIKSMTNGTATNKNQKPPPATSKVSLTLASQPPQRRPSLVSTTIQRLTSVEPDSPTEAPSSPFKRNQTLTRSTSGGISSTIEKLERQQSETETVNGITPKSFQRSSSVRQRVNQMNQVEPPKQTIKDGTQTVGRRPIVPRPNLPRPSNGTMKFLNELSNPSIVRVPLQSQNGNIRLENEEARVGTTVNVADMNGTVSASNPNVKKLVYGTYRNLLGAYNIKANNVVTNQSNTMVVQDRGVTEQLGKITGPTAPQLQGNTPTQRMRSEFQANPVPPPCIQNAMMTKDKKPFTYTPGGIDLSEIRSPRMAKRIERNAQAQGVGEVPRSPNTYQPSGPLPASALAAMQTNMPVQVFPSGAAPPPPPPPPPQQQVRSAGGMPPPPPPPPPPQGPLPTKPISTNEGVFDRPDMTQIIPENPMAMLRKTPKVDRKTFLDELNDMERQQTRPQYPPSQQYQPSPPMRQNNIASPQYQPQAAQYAPPLQQTQQYAPPVQQSPPIQQSTSYNNNSAAGSSNNHNQRSQVGALYIPPVTQQSNGQSGAYEVTSPPTPPVRSPQSPQSPQTQLNKAPRPWQNQKREEERPQWAHKAERVSPPQDEYIAPPYMPQQGPEPPRRQQSYQQQPAEYYSPTQVLKEPPPPMAGVEVVWVTQPQVMVHPGAAPPQPRSPQPKQQQVDSQGARIIPIQVEREQPPTPERNFNRQQSWGAPTQSNTFKVLQKLTSTDGDLEDNSPTTEHGPKTSQEFNQTPADQIRKMKLSQDQDRELVHKFKQGPMIEYYYYEEDPRYRGGHIPSRGFWILDESDDDTYLQREVDPRYRGPAIPSKAFRLLQAMTDSYTEVFPPQQQGTSSSNVPRGQSQQTTPHVRNIPIQIEGDDSPGPYVHPSQQTVQEPKKYTGGNIPGRSFKMLQSMTGQASPLASNSENYQTNHPYNPHNMYPPPLPYFPYLAYDPYWSNYYYPQQQIPEDHPKTRAVNSRSTTPSVCSSCRNTPVPFWNYYYPMPYYQDQETDEESEYPHMWDPYYYHYYYYYPPVQTPQLPKNLKRRSYADFEEVSSNHDTQQIPKHLKRRSYDANSEDCSSSNDVPKDPKRRYYSDSEDWTSSNDEIAYYTQQAKGVQNEILPAKTPTLPIDKQIEDTLEAEDEDSNDSEEDVSQPKESSGSLQSVKSVKDMKTLNQLEDDVEDDNDGCSENYQVEDASATEEVSLDELEDIMPHVLSVILEESEFSNRNSRASSVFTDLSDDTIILVEDNDNCEAVNVKLPLKLAYTVDCDREAATEITGEATKTADIDSDSKEFVVVIKSILEECKSSSDSSEIDFWSEIITEEEVVPKPNRLQQYKNAIQNVEVVTNKTIEKIIEESEICTNNYNRTSYDIVGVNEKEQIQISNAETSVSSFEFNKRNANKKNRQKTQRQVDKANPTCKTLNKSSSVKETADSIVVVNVEDYKLSSLAFEQQEELQILIAPKFELELSVQDFCNNRNVDETEDICQKSDSEESSSEELIEKLCTNSQEFHNFVADCDEIIPANQDKLEYEDKPLDISKINDDCSKVDSETTDSEEEVKTNDTLDTVEDLSTPSEERLTLCQVEVVNSSNRSSLSRSSSTSGKEHFEGEESEEDESGPDEDDHETPVIELETQELQEKSDQNNNEEIVLEIPSIKDRIKSLQEASCKPIKKIIATITEVPKATNTTPSTTQNKSIDNSEDEGDSGVTSDMSRHISDSESEFSELRKWSRYERAATHSRLYQLLHSSCSEEELQQEEVQDSNKCMMKRREHLTLPLKKSVESESSSGLNSPTSPLTDKLAYELVLSLLRKKKGQAFRSMPIERLHAAALKILQEDKDCTDLSSSEEFHNCLSPLRNDTECSTPAQTPAEFYTNCTYNDYYATWQNYDSESNATAKCPRVPLVPTSVSPKSRQTTCHLETS